MLNIERRSTDDAWRRAHFQLISAILYQADPMGRIENNSGEEYDSEARHIIKTLHRTASIDEVETLIFNTFSVGTGDEATLRMHTLAISAEVFRLLTQFAGQSGTDGGVPQDAQH